MLQTVEVAPPHLIVDQLLMLGCRWVAGYDLPSRQGDVPAPRGASQLIPDPVLDGAPQAGPHGTGLFRLELVKPRELLPQSVLDQIAGVDGPARPRRQPAPRPTPQPGPVPRKQYLGCGSAAASSSREEPVRAGIAGVAEVGRVFGVNRHRFVCDERQCGSCPTALGFGKRPRRPTCSLLASQAPVRTGGRARATWSNPTPGTRRGRQTMECCWTSGGRTSRRIARPAVGWITSSPAARSRRCGPHARTGAGRKAWTCS